MTDDHEEKARLEVGKKANEALGIPDPPLITQTEETHLPEVGNPDIFEVYPEDIIKESPKEPEYQNEFLKETPKLETLQVKQLTMMKIQNNLLAIHA
ncbi:PREDICTED: LOC110755632 partial [Prunus dulcis]|uniref:PREDICTED: LOC110755632 partial n=1 Tax=Prunus dulcis TaxID=3755 RepID=A0A5E4FIR9_PRUDU|nr:PREDICTED: LOC110755632 partial [Prunus dulcis]